VITKHFQTTETLRTPSRRSRAIAGIRTASIALHRQLFIDREIIFYVGETGTSVPGCRAIHVRRRNSFIADCPPAYAGGSPDVDISSQHVNDRRLADVFARCHPLTTHQSRIVNKLPDASVYFATPTERISRMTTTFTSPG
jgi:hypothetical protein